MKYRIQHKTWYDYADLVPICHNLTHLVPRTTPTQQQLEYKLKIEPVPAFLTNGADYFGNHVEHFSIETAHRRLEIVAESKVEVLPSETPEPSSSAAWEACRPRQPAVGGNGKPASTVDPAILQFTFSSPRVPELPELREYAAPSFSARRPVVEAVMNLSARIHADFKFDARATTVETPLMQVLRQRRGVCQDFAQLAIGCLRSMGLAARYVSGYLRTVPPPGRTRLIGADATHAWCSVWCGPLGWIDFDPTNNCLVGDSHVTIGWGRDYGDVCPIQGVFVGGGEHRIGVSVDVTPLADR